MIRLTFCYVIMLQNILLLKYKCSDSLPNVMEHHCKPRWLHSLSQCRPPQFSFRQLRLRNDRRLLKLQQWGQKFNLKQCLVRCLNPFRPLLPDATTIVWFNAQMISLEKLVWMGSRKMPRSFWFKWIQSWFAKVLKDWSSFARPVMRSLNASAINFWIVYRCGIWKLLAKRTPMGEHCDKSFLLSLRNVLLCPPVSHKFEKWTISRKSLVTNKKY